MAATPIPTNAAGFDTAELEAAGARLHAGERGAYVGVTTDSRAVREGNLFVALRGARHDGHEHIAAACAAGARAILVEREVEAPSGVAVYRVDDTLVGLGALAAHHLGRFPVDVVAITGSVGKTTTKELTRAALRGAGRAVLATEGNLNNRIGVPMTLFMLDASHDCAVLELGMSLPGEIATLAAMVRPRVGVVTAIEAVHTEGVGDLQGVLREKGALLAALGADGTAIWRARDADLARFAEAAGTRWTFGAEEGVDARLASFELTGHAGTRVEIRVPGRDAALALTLRLLGEPAALSATAALAVVAALAPTGLEGAAVLENAAVLESAARALEEAAPIAHRMVPNVLASGLLVLDDTYNASPASMRAALETAAAIAAARGGRLLAVLGDMLELGLDEERAHREVGRAAVEAGAAQLVACGERMTMAGRAALSASMERSGAARTKVALLRNVEDAAACVREVARPTDVVLVKGSRGMRLERVVEDLVAEHVVAEPVVGSGPDEGEEDA